LVEKLYVAWQDETSRTWHTIARLTRDSEGYELIFTQGASRLGDLPERLFRMQLKYRYRFETLINMFRNKIPSRSRPDFEKMARWLNLTGSENEFALLSKFGLIPSSDALLVYPEPKVGGGKYELEFFVHGVRHMHPDVLKWCDNLEPGGRLLPVLDVQNPVDRHAVALRSETDTILVGYVPTFYAGDLKRILSDEALCAAAKITVVRNNKDAPIQLRLLCRFESPISPDFQPLDSTAHKPALELQAV
jgi:hypothetical protein